MIIFKILLFIGTILSIVLLSLGGILLFKKMKYDKSATADVTKVRCQEGTNKCNITMTFKANGDKTYTVSAIVTGPVKEESTRGIIYDSTNPNNFYPSQPPVRMIGAGLFVLGIIIALGCAAGAYFMFRTPPAPVPDTVLTPDQATPVVATTAAKEASYESPSPIASDDMQRTRDDNSFNSWQATEKKESPEEASARQFADERVREVTEPARRSLF